MGLQPEAAKPLRTVFEKPSQSDLCKEVLKLVSSASPPAIRCQDDQLRLSLQSKLQPPKSCPSTFARPRRQLHQRSCLSDLLFSFSNFSTKPETVVQIGRRLDSVCSAGHA